MMSTGKRWRIRSPLIVAIACALWVSTANALDYAPNCEKELAPVYWTGPTLPAQLHNEFSGSVIVHFTVLPNGKVHNPVVFSSNLEPEGSGRGQPVGYDEAVLDALRLWRYPARQESCLHEATIELQWNE